MRPPGLGAHNGDHESLRSQPYEAMASGRPPIPITVAPTPSSAQLDLHPSLRPQASIDSVTGHATRSQACQDSRRDSGMASSQVTARESRTTLGTMIDSGASVKKSRSLPRVQGSGPKAQQAHPMRDLVRKLSGPNPPQLEQPHQQRGDEPSKTPAIPLLQLSTDIPTITFDDLTSEDNIQFSKRGSVLIGGRRANEAYRMTKQSGKDNTQKEQEPIGLALRSTRRVLSDDEEALSRKVRSMYDNGLDEPQLAFSGSSPSASNQDTLETGRNGPYVLVDQEAQNGNINTSDSMALKNEEPRARWELAGGIEYWENVGGGDVDRYGFIDPKPVAHNASTSSLPATSPPHLHRVSTALQIASEAPRRQHSKLGRSASITKSTRSMGQVSNTNSKHNTSSRRPLSSQSSYRSVSSLRTSRLRIAANRLPHNRERRAVDEAGSMLTLPPGLADIAEYEDDGRAGTFLKAKEWERESKWRKMARREKGVGRGGGMTFSFDTTNQKLIERTWKGIPDRWRATAWHSFLTASAKKRPGSPTDEELKATFRDLHGESSPDDVQIDIDVPRTINGHVMFRKRYRGGQRLLFRVLHCLSLYFPEVGYVQGMAALAATFLCYFDEEMSFVMLVRMWQERGLERLYQHGFGGLMQALEEFEQKWLKNGEIGSRLTEFGITPTAYGTRWYLTVFNYSIPFAAQLRIWDVFLLLGEEDKTRTVKDGKSFNGQLDVLHATAAALIDATRDILLDSDFENTMKVLTSWIPIRDEDMLLQVAKAEWKAYTRGK